MLKGNKVNIVFVLGVFIFLIPSFLDKGFGITLSKQLHYIFAIIGVLLLIVSIIAKII